ncbi:MAG: hypothetical protein GY811_19595 [Myxococcales bacterium]|nr:hypothetical protein [Myxococcales bacterium]
MARANDRSVLRTLLLGGGVLVSASCAGETTSSSETAKNAVTRPPVEIVVISRKDGLADYPCQQCHQHTGGESDAPIDAHTQIRVRHMSGGDNCQTCHDANNPENLRLATGKTYDLDEVHMLCGQCHSKEAGDWAVGVHGKQVGNWLTKIQRFSCTGCHDPHEPALSSEVARPAPPFSRFGIPKGAH